MGGSRSGTVALVWANLGRSGNGTDIQVAIDCIEIRVSQEELL